MTKHTNAGQVGTARMRKSDGGYRAIILNESQRGLWLKGEEVMNRQFHPLKKGEEFNAVIRISDTGRKMVQKVQSKEGIAMTSSKTRSKRGGFLAVEDVDPVGARLDKEWHERQQGGTPAKLNSTWEKLEDELRKGGVVLTVDSPLNEPQKTLVVPAPQPVAVDVAEDEALKEKEVKVEKVAPASKLTDGYYIAPDMRLAFNKALRMSLNHPERAVKLMMVGPSGYGKTTLPRLFAEMVGYTYMRMDCAKVRDPEEWFGYREAIDGSTVFIKSNFAKALERGNLVVVMDEFNRLEPWIHNSLFPLLDDAGCTTVHDEEFRIGPNVLVVGTINLGYKYTGTFELDEALLNRFDFFLEVGPMEQREEVAVLVKRTGIRKDAAEEIVNMANRLRTQEVICSTRTTLQVAEKVATGMNLRQAFEYTVVRRIPSDNTGNSLRKSVVDSINTYLGAFEIEAIENDVFEVGVSALKPDVIQVTEIKSVHYLELHANSASIGMLHLIGAIRQLPLVEALTMNQAKELAERIRDGDKVQLNLREKPEEFERMVKNFNSMGVGGKYRSIVV